MRGVFDVVDKLRHLRGERRLDISSACRQDPADHRGRGQETAEQPQLYFDHMAKQGDAYQLAHEIRDGLDKLDVE